jgi:hypothetical protein
VDFFALSHKHINICLYLYRDSATVRLLVTRTRPTQWQPLDIDISGPAANERDDAPNPFLDFRLNITLTGPGDAAGTAVGIWAVTVVKLIRLLALQRLALIKHTMTYPSSINGTLC